MMHFFPILSGYLHYEKPSNYMIDMFGVCHSIEVLQQSQTVYISKHIIGTRTE